MFEGINLFTGAIGLFLTIFAAVWSLAWWLSGKFSSVQEYLQSRIEEVEKNILNKLEYHERHDDTRFSGIHNDIWELRIHNAAQDNYKKQNTENPKPRPQRPETPTS